jgi:predicted XRE-type DNA-binding protein
MTAPPTLDEATVKALRADIALQLSRLAGRSPLTQTALARRWGLPQPTLSKITHGRVSDLSIELLIRVAVRAGLPITLQTGREAAEAGAFVSAVKCVHSPLDSPLAARAREAVQQTDLGLTPSARLEAFLHHNELLAALRESGRAAEEKRLSGRGRRP